MTNVTITISVESAEPILRKAAYDAAYNSALCDYITQKTYNSPWRWPEPFAKAKSEWRDAFLTAKRLVESFGVEYQQTSEEETLTVHYPIINSKRKVVNVGGSIGKIGFSSGGVQDFKHPQPAHRGEVHREACKAAADRVVKAWRAQL